MDIFELNATPRQQQGTGASRRLRHAGMVPAILYGAGEPPVMLTVSQQELSQHLKHEAFYSHILTLRLDGKAHKAILKDMQRHPVHPIVLHLDLLRVSETTEIRVHVPLHFTHADTCLGVRAGGVVTHNLAEVEIACLPKDLPEYIEVDLAPLNLGDIVHLSQLNIPAGVRLVALGHGADHDLPVVSIVRPRVAEEAPAAAPAEGGAAPAAG